MAPPQPQRAAQPAANRRAAQPQAPQPQPARPGQPVSGGKPAQAFTDEGALEDDLLIVEDGDEGPGQPRPDSQVMGACRHHLCRLQGRTLI